jgi:acyl carrier protein
MGRSRGLNLPTMSLFERLQPVIAATLKLPPAAIGPTTGHDDIPANWDSLGQVNLIMSLEEAFGIYVEPEHFERLKSVPAILQYLDEQGVR